MEFLSSIMCSVSKQLCFLTVGGLNTFTLPFGLQPNHPVPAPSPVQAAPAPAQAAPAPAQAGRAPAQAAPAIPQLDKPLHDVTAKTRQPAKQPVQQPSIAQLTPQIKRSGTF